MLSPVELLDALVDHIEARNPSLNALVFTAFDEARDRARRAEQALPPGEALGPLHGIPTALEDLFDFEPGWPATFGGVRALAGFSVPARCTYAERMQAAGAVLVGKTNSPVMGFRGTCDNYVFGPSRNPFDTSKYRAVTAFEEAGAAVDEVELRFDADQRELSDLWCWLIAPLNGGGLEGIAGQGPDLLGEHRDDFPPEYLRWIDEGYRLSALDVLRDKRMRTRVYDRVEGVDVDPLIGWCLTYPVDFTGHPAASVPAGDVDGLPVGMQLTGRRYADADVLAASAAFERLRPWQAAYARCARPLG